MPRRIILHGGFHKTGTSSIQETLRDNRGLLKRHVALRLRWHLRDVVAAARGYSTWRDPLTLIKAQHRFHAMTAGLPAMPRRTLIISAEELAGHMPGRPDVPDYSAAPILMHAYWEILAQAFPASEIILFLTTRAAGPWLASAYWEHVKASSMTLDFSEFAARTAPAADLSAVVADVAARVPCRVIESPLEASAERPLGPAAALLDLCKLPDTLHQSLSAPPPANPGAGADILHALLEANRTIPDAAARDAAKAQILQRADKR